MTICSMRIACCITKATNTHSEYVIFIDFSLQQCLQEPISVLRYTYISSLAQEVKPSGSPFLIRHVAPGFNVRFHRYAEVTPGLSSDRPGRGRRNISKYFMTAFFLHSSTPASVHCTSRPPRCIIDFEYTKGTIE